MDQEKKPDALDQTPRSWVRVTLTGACVKHLEKVSDDLISQAKNKNLKILRVTTRKTPCGEGSKTWDRYQMRIHKRVIHLRSTSEIPKDLNYISLEPGVYCDVKVAGE